MDGKKVSMKSNIEPKQCYILVRCNDMSNIGTQAVKVSVVTSKYPDIPNGCDAYCSRFKLIELPDTDRLALIDVEDIYAIVHNS